MSDVIESEDIERDGQTYRVEIIADFDCEEPWNRSDGHGPVSDWQSEDSKRPGERVLHSDHRSCRFYDFAEATRIAKRDGWGVTAEESAAMEKRLGRKPTRKEIVAAAVESDFQFLKSWCDDEWSYVGIRVTLLDEDEEETGDDASLWGIESNADDYHQEIISELIGQITHDVNAREEKAKARELAADGLGLA